MFIILGLGLLKLFLLINIILSEQVKTEKTPKFFPQKNRYSLRERVRPQTLKTFLSLSHTHFISNQTLFPHSLTLAPASPMLFTGLFLSLSLSLSEILPFFFFFLSQSNLLNFLVSLFGCSESVGK